MPVIVNVPKFDATNIEPTRPTTLIRISDPAQGFSPLKYGDKFHDVHEFEFLDADDGQFEDCVLFQPEQATEIISILVDALDENRDVIVHCNMGICRSGAVVEIGVIMGFTDTGKHRQPNLRVKRMLVNEAIERNLI